jgi:drug/metabolite transporter (DMT)-like permease
VLLAALILVPVVRGSFGDIRRFVTDRGIEALSIGAFGLGIAQGLAYTSLGYTSAVNFGIIFSTTPIMTLVLAGILLREPLGPWQALGSLVAFAGIVTITVKGDPRLLLGLDLGIGDLLAIAASVAFAGYTVLLKRAKFELARLPLLVVLMTGGAIASFPFFLYELASGRHDNLDVHGIPGALCYIWSIDVLGSGARRRAALLPDGVHRFPGLAVSRRVDRVVSLVGQCSDRPRHCSGVVSQTATGRSGEVRRIF